MKKLEIMYFYATWCSPCKMLSPIFSDLIEEFKNNEEIQLKKIDVDNNSELTIKFGVRSVPTILFIKNDEVVDKFVGATNKQVLIDKIESLR